MEIDNSLYNMRNHHITIDVEEWFHLTPSEMPSVDKWQSLENRVEANTHKILDLLDENSQKSTFFFLGWIAKNYPSLVKEVFTRGHEVASHGFYHEDVSKMTLYELKRDISDTKSLLEDIISNEVYGYRSPVFTGHTEEFFETVSHAGYKYDSSVFPAKRNSGDASGFPRVPFRLRFEDNRQLFEFPITIINFLGNNFPVGGGYFRAYPLWLNKSLAEKAKKNTGYFMFYLHPREVDANHPRLEIENRLNRVKRYIGMKGVVKKLQGLMKQIVSVRIVDVMNEVE